MFLSLKKYLDGSTPELEAALLQLCQLLLRSMRLFVIRGEESEVQRFQGAVLNLEQRIATVPEPAEVLMAAGEASRAFEDYCHHTNRYLHVQSDELTTMIGMLTATVTGISNASQTAVDELGRVEKRIETAGNSTDLSSVKAELAECLALLREEAFRQRESSAHTIHTLQRSVSDAQHRLAEACIGTAQPAAEPLMRDALTDLPARADAEDALFQARTKRHVYVAVLPVDRLALVNTRFGPRATDHVVQFFADYLRQHVQEGDQLFRWSANSFLALVERTRSQDTVRADMSKFASAKLELTLQHHGREILLPVSSTWVLLSATEGRTHDAMVAKIDGFLLSEMHVKDSF